MVAAIEAIDVKLSADPQALGVRHLEQWGGFWAMREDEYRLAAATLRRLDLAAHVKAQQEQQQRTPLNAKQAAQQPFQVHAGVTAVIEIKGMMTKYGSSLSSSGSTVRARQAIRAALADSTIKNILLWIESPGGSTRGVKELADEVAAANKQKPVTAYIEDLGCSAAYFVASQAGRIVANDSAMVGSIGTYMVVDDWSKAYEEAGIKTYVVRAGAFKGAGETGTEVTEEQLAEWQRLVTQINEHFTSAVKKGRGMSAARLKEIADGRCHIAADALSLGLIDVIEPIEKTLATLAKNPGSKGAKAVSDTPTEKTYAQQLAENKAAIKAACPGAPDSFVAEQVAGGVTVEQAKDAWAEHRIKAAQAEANEAKKRADEAEQKLADAGKTGTQQSGSTGVDPEVVADQAKGKKDPGQSGDPIKSFQDRFEAKLKANGGDRVAAMQATVEEDPQAHEDYLAAYNAKHPNAHQSLKRQIAK